MNRYLHLALLLLVFAACQPEKISYNTAPKADFTVGEEMYELGQKATFTDHSMPATGNTLVKWEWTFGEGEKAVSSEQNPTFIYSAGGTFTVELKVTDNNGLSASVKKDVTIVDPTKAINIVWQKPVLGSIQNTVSPAMSPDGKTVYMIADQSAANAYDVQLKAYDVATGNECWAFNVNDALVAQNIGGGVRLVYASPAVGADGSVYVTVRDLRNSGAARKTFLFAVNASGKLKWNYNFGIDANINYISPAIDADGNIYVGHLTAKPFAVTVINGSDGTLAKQIPLSVGVRSGLALSKTGDVYFCSTGANGLFAYDNKKEQKFNYNADISVTGGAISVDADGTVYTVATLSGGGGVVALNADGTSKWVVKTPGVIQYGGVVVASDGTVYANAGKSVDGETSAGVIAINKDGSVKWHFGTTEDNNNNVPVIDNRGYIHFVTDKAIYYILKPDGTLFSSKELGEKTYSSPVMGPDGKIYIAVETSAGISELLCISSGATSFAQSSWPMRGQNPQRTGLQK